MGVTDGNTSLGKTNNPEKWEDGNNYMNWIRISWFLLIYNHGNNGHYYFSIHIFPKLTLSLYFNTGKKKTQKHLEIFYSNHLKPFINALIRIFRVNVSDYHAPPLSIIHSNNREELQSYKTLEVFRIRFLLTFLCLKLMSHYYTHHWRYEVDSIVKKRKKKNYNCIQIFGEVVFLYFKLVLVIFSNFL